MLLAVRIVVTLGERRCVMTGRGMKEASRVLAVLCFLIWVLLTWRCSL